MRRYTLVSAVFLGVIAVAHLIRAFMGWPILIADVAVPAWGSVAAAVFTAALSAWGVREAGRK